MNWVLTDEHLDVETELALGFLDYLMLGTNASPLRKAMNDSGLGAAVIGGGIDDELKQPIFGLGLKGVDPANVDKVWHGFTQCGSVARVRKHVLSTVMPSRPPAGPFTCCKVPVTKPGLCGRLLLCLYACHIPILVYCCCAQVEELVLSKLQELAKQGFSASATEAALNTIEFSLRENNTGSFPRGLSMMLRSVGAWIYDRDPFQPIQVGCVWGSVGWKCVSQGGARMLCITHTWVKAMDLPSLGSSALTPVVPLHFVMRYAVCKTNLLNRCRARNAMALRLPSAILHVHGKVERYQSNVLGRGPPCPPIHLLDLGCLKPFVYMCLIHGRPCPCCAVGGGSEQLQDQAGFWRGRVHPPHQQVHPQQPAQVRTSVLGGCTRGGVGKQGSFTCGRCTGWDAEWAITAAEINGWRINAGWCRNS